MLSARGHFLPREYISPGLPAAGRVRMTTHVHTHVPPPGVRTPHTHTGEPGQGALHAQWAVTLASPQVRGRGQAVSSRDPLTQLAGPHGVQGLQRSAQQRQPHREPRAGRGPGSVHLLGRAFPWRPGRRINRTSSVARRENNLKLLDGSRRVVTAGQPCGQEPGARGPHRLQNPQPGRPRATAGVPAAGSAQRLSAQAGREGGLSRRGHSNGHRRRLGPP